MKKYVKDALDTLADLGCHLDHKDRELRKDRWRFTHPAAESGEFFTIAKEAKEQSVRTVVQRAKVVAGLASSDTLEKRKPKANRRLQQERAAERARMRTAQQLADARRAREEAERASAVLSKRRREMDSLMRGRSEVPAADSIAATAMLTLAQVADQTGLTDKAVQRAVDSGAIEAYMCGGEVKVKGSDVRAWIHGGAA